MIYTALYASNNNTTHCQYYEVRYNGEGENSCNGNDNLTQYEFFINSSSCYILRKKQNNNSSARAPNNLLDCLYFVQTCSNTISHAMMKMLEFQKDNTKNGFLYRKKNNIIVFRVDAVGNKETTLKAHLPLIADKHYLADTDTNDEAFNYNLKNIKKLIANIHKTDTTQHIEYDNIAPHVLQPLNKQMLDFCTNVIEKYTSDDLKNELIQNLVINSYHYLLSCFMIESVEIKKQSNNIEQIKQIEQIEKSMFTTTKSCVDQINSKQKPDEQILEKYTQYYDQFMKLRDNTNTKNDDKNTTNNNWSIILLVISGMGTQALISKYTKKQNNRSVKKSKGRRRRVKKQAGQFKGNSTIRHN